MRHVCRWALHCAVPSLLMIAAATLAHAQDEVALSEYRGRLGVLRSQTGDADDARNNLSVIKRVRLPNGTRITLDNATFAPSVSAADARIRANVLDTLLAPLGPASDRRDPKEAARAILADPEFEEASSAPGDSWLDRTLRGIGDAIRRFFEWLFGNGPTMPKGDTSGFAAFLALLLRFVLFVAVTLGVVWGGLYVSRLVTARRGKFKRDGVLSGLDLDDTIADPLGTARELATRGEMRQALRLAYIACLRRLAASGLLVLQESRTNWEYQSALRTRSQDAAVTLLPATRLFDLVWYGGREATIQEWEQVLAIHDALPLPLIESTTGAKTVDASSRLGKENGNAW